MLRNIGQGFFEDAQQMMTLIGRGAVISLSRCKPSARFSWQVNSNIWAANRSPKLAASVPAARWTTCSVLLHRPRLHQFPLAPLPGARAMTGCGKPRPL
jgi:hypothetical protein